MVRALLIVRDQPRIEVGLQLQVESKDDVKCSPRARGWTRTSTPTTWRYGGHPARAGMDRVQAGLVYAKSGLPRTRGEKGERDSGSVRSAQTGSTNPSRTRRNVHDEERQVVRGAADGR